MVRSTGTSRGYPLGKAFDRSAVPAAAPPGPIAPDCRHFRGDRPCRHQRACQGCELYEPWSVRVCIIKLGPLHEVIETLTLVHSLRRLHPRAQVTFLTQPDARRMLEDHPLLDRVLEFDLLAAMVLAQEQFDTVICLDRRPAPCALAMSLFARQKLGIGLSSYGTPTPLNDSAMPFFLEGIRSPGDARIVHPYPRLIHDAVAIPMVRQRYQLTPPPAGVDRARLRLAAAGWQPDRPTLGVHITAATRRGDDPPDPPDPPDPATPLIRSLIELHRGDPRLQFLALAEADARHAADDLADRLAQAQPGARLLVPDADNDLLGLLAPIECCQVVLTRDTPLLRLAVALDKPVVALHDTPAPPPVETYDRVRWVMSQSCPREATDASSAAEVDDASHDAIVPDATDATDATDASDQLPPLTLALRQLLPAPLNPDSTDPEPTEPPEFTQPPEFPQPVEHAEHADPSATGDTATAPTLPIEPDRRPDALAA